MRMIIKGADFSAVSIGKVVKDLSFEFLSGKGNAYVNAFFPNFNSGTPTETVYYKGSEGGSVTAQIPTSNRIVSDFIEVSEGMTITGQPWATSSDTTPAIVAFDESKNVLSSYCKWIDGSTATLIVPASVKFVKIQTGATESILNYLVNEANTMNVHGNMPE